MNEQNFCVFFLFRKINPVSFITLDKKERRSRKKRNKVSVSFPPLFIPPPLHQPYQNKLEKFNDFVLHYVSFPIFCKVHGFVI